MRVRARLVDFRSTSSFDFAGNETERVCLFAARPATMDAIRELTRSQRQVHPGLGFCISQ
jgi:hypothetical protein